MYRKEYLRKNESDVMMFTKYTFRLLSRQP